MAARHVDITFSTAPTKSQAQRFFSLILQNVTDFSGYTADPVIGSYLTGGGTVTVNAVGDNMPVIVVNEWNAGTANAVTVLQIGNLYYIIANSTSGNSSVIACSLSATSYIYPGTTRTVTPINASLYNSAPSAIALNGYKKYSMRISESYFAFAHNETSGTVNTSGFVDAWLARLYAKHDSDLLFFNRCDGWTYAGLADKSEKQVTCGMALYPTSGINPYRPVKDIVSTNLGPLNDSFINTFTVSNVTAIGATVYVASLPSSYRETPGGLTKKPVFQFKFYDMNSGKKYDVSGIHNVLMLAYAKYEDYSAVVTNNGTTYRAVGGFLFAS